MEKNNLEIFKNDLKKDLLFYNMEKKNNLEILKNDLKKDLLFYNMENNLEILKNSENNNLSINTMDNIIEILKRKINRKINENVKHKASLRAFDDYIKNLGDDKTKLKQFNVQMDNLNLKEDLLEELDLLKNVFIRNGYLEQLVTKTLIESWPRETLKAVLKGVEQDVEVENGKDYFEVLHAPYVKGFTEGLQRRLRKLNIGFVPKRRETIYTNLCKLKQKVKFEDCKDVIYSVPCEKCGVRYIGETGQHFCQRREQHKGDIRNKKESNGFYSHLKRNKGHSVNWEGAVFLDREKHWRGRKIKEALFINSQNPARVIDPKNILNLEKGFNLDPIWSGFNESFREIMSKKVQK